MLKLQHIEILHLHAVYIFHITLQLFAITIYSMFSKQYNYWGYLSLVPSSNNEGLNLRIPFKRPKPYTYSERLQLPEIRISNKMIA